MSNYESPFVLRNVSRLPTHLNDAYGIDVSALTELDLGVLRVDRHDGPSWVARVFPATRPLADVRKDADALRRLEQGGFPAERTALTDAVTQFEGQGVLVSTFIPGVRPKSDGRTFAYLGALLGRLHSHEGASVGPGGGWHHLVSSGTPNDEVTALQNLMDVFAPRVENEDVKVLKALRKQVDALDVCDDLPHCFVHPDMVPMNALELDDRSLVIVDWTNAGRGPRLWSLGMTLFAAGARDMRLVEKVISRYIKHTSLDPDELERLEGAIYARPLTIHAWEIVRGRKALADTPLTIRFLQRVSAQIADTARAAFALERG
jgi:Ser/Thr protein kinase RdoA (MazF antagonist)